MYKNIIFDLGGVMVDFDPKTYLVDRFCNAEVEEQVSQLTFESEEWKLLDAGLITRSEANLRMLARAKEYGRAFEVQGVLDDWMHILRPRRRMQELVRKLKSRGYCVYYLSNIPEDVLEFLTERDLKGLFDGGVASCEVHINKPDPRIYKALLDKYQLKAVESVFIDDRLENVQAAFRLGFFKHPDEGQRRHTGAQPCYLQCGHPLNNTQNSPLNALSGALGGEFSAITDYFFS